MSDKKFTPGPWVGFDGKRWPKNNMMIDFDDSYSSCFVSVNNQDGHSVAAIVSYDENISDVELFANAHLIAAAPEMYRMLDVLSRKLPDEMTAEYYEIIGLLSKARGE